MRKLGVVGVLARIESQIFEQQKIAVSHVGHCAQGVTPDGFVELAHGLAQ